MKHRDTFQKFVRYIAIGGLSLMLYLLLLSAFVRGLHVPVFIGNLAAYAIATVFNFFGNYIWAFRSQQTRVQAGARFGTVVAIGVLANAVLVPQLVAIGMTVELAGLMFALIWPIVSFTALNFWALR